MKLGKQPATPKPTDLKFATYLDAATLPTIPGSFGLDHVLPIDGWGMLGNDQYGDCVWAGACHETEVLTGRGDSYGAPALFTDSDALNAYAACTGFNPHDPNSDQGTNVHDAMTFRRNQGIADSHGSVHKIGAYLSIDISNPAELWTALYLFECVGIGIQFPASAMKQFDNGQPWSVVPGSQIEGGHYVPILSKQGTSTCKVVTWGRLQTVTQGFLSEYLDEAWAYVSVDALKSDGTSFRGLNLAQLQADLAAL